MKRDKKWIVLIVFFSWISLSLNAQEEKDNFVKRVLFILDGSGSMNEKWLGETKWEMATSTLSNLIDSFEKINPNFEIGIRVLGHQYSRELHRCDDTKLEVPFSKEWTYEKVDEILKRIRPKGHTPLAYSLEQSEGDFQLNNKVQNIIILITDGLENCNGNPCEVSTRLREKNIFINPYIIGLGIDSLESQKLECIGKFIDAKNKIVFKEVIKTILTEVSVRTTLTIQFVKSDSTPYPHYVPFSLIDKKSKKDIQSFIFSNTTKKILDTIQVNPQYQYDLLIHSNPPFYYVGFNIEKGRHQHYNIPIVSGMIQYQTPNKTKRNLFFMRDSDFHYVHWHSGIQPFIRREANHQNIDMIHHPISTKKDIWVKEDGKVELPYIAKGILSIKKEPNVLASLYNQNWEKILTIDSDVINTYELIEGEYFVLSKSFNEHSDKSKFQSFRIVENLTTQILIQ